MNFSGKIVLVTGGAVRAGAAICRRFAEAGATVVVHCLRHRAEANELIAALPGSGHRVIVQDLSCEDAAEKLWAAAGKIDFLVNNASLYFHLAADTAETAKKMMLVNFATPVKLMELFAENAAPGGCVVNILDQEILGRGDLHGGAYSESRRRLAESTLEYAVKYAARDIRFNAVAPGRMIPPPEISASKMEKSISFLPLKRKVEVDDFADTVLFLAQNRSITGAIVPVDCGQSLKARVADNTL